jgi:PEP-CTERM motif
MNTASKWTRRARLGAQGEAGRQRPSPGGLGLACVMVCLVSRIAGAVPLTTLPQVVAFSGAVSVTDTKATPGATTAHGASFPSITVNKYTGADILTGVQLHLTSTRTPSGTVTASGGTLPRNATGTGSGTGQITLPGVTQAFPAVTASSACTKTTGTSSCTASTTGAAQPTNQTFHVTTGLASYYGPGTFSVTRTAPTLVATAAGTFTSSTFTSQEAWTGTLSTSYEYSKHANASFAPTSDLDTLVLDFGPVAPHSTTQQSWSLFNLPDPAGMTAGLGLTSVSSAGDTAAFSIPDLVPPFLPLAAGSGQTFLATFEPTQPGMYSATYLLHLADEAIGIGGTTSTVAFTLTGQAVPEPSTWLLFATGGAGLFGYGWQRRQQAV